MICGYEEVHNTNELSLKCCKQLIQFGNSKIESQLWSRNSSYFIYIIKSRVWLANLVSGSVKVQLSKKVVVND